MLGMVSKCKVDKTLFTHFHDALLTNQNSSLFSGKCYSIGLLDALLHLYAFALCTEVLLFLLM